MIEENQKTKEYEGRIYLSQWVNLLFDQKIGLGKVLDTLSQDYEIKKIDELDGSATIILTPKKNG